VGIGNVARAATKITPQCRHQKGHVEDVKLIRKDLIGKTPLKRHDGVERQGTTDDCCHVVEVAFC